MNITSLQEKLADIGYDAASSALLAEKANLDVQYDIAQKAFNKSLVARGIAPEDFYFNPQDSYIRLSDHAERRLHRNTWMCVDLNRSQDTAMGMSLLGIRFESKNYIQDVKPEEQNLIVCAETLEYFAELMRAFNKTLVDDYIGIVNQYWAHILSMGQKSKTQAAAVELGKKYIQAAQYATTVLMPCGIDTQEDMKEYFGSIHGEELTVMWELMGSPGTYSTKAEKLRETIYEFFTVDETKRQD
jgi:hypothetical protein